MAGISARQGGHQDAHRLTTTGLPRNSDSVISPPPSRSRVKSGAAKPSRGVAICSAAFAAAGGRRDNNVQPAPNDRTTIIINVHRRCPLRKSAQLPMIIYILDILSLVLNES